MYISTRNNLYLQAATLFVLINAFNLLPLYPLDGGHFWEAILFSRHPILEIVFKIVTLGLLGLIGYFTHAWFLLTLAILVFFRLRNDFLVASTSKKIRNSAIANGEIDLPLTKESLTRLNQEVETNAFYSSLPNKTKGLILLRIWQRIHLTSPRIGASIFSNPHLPHFKPSCGYIVRRPINLERLYEYKSRLVRIKSSEGSLVPAEVKIKNGVLIEEDQIDSSNLYDGRSISLFDGKIVSMVGQYVHGNKDGQWLNLPRLGILPWFNFLKWVN